MRMAESLCRSASAMYANDACLLWPLQGWLPCMGTFPSDTVAFNCMSSAFGPLQLHVKTPPNTASTPPNTASISLIAVHHSACHRCCVAEYVPSLFLLAVTHIYTLSHHGALCQYYTLSLQLLPSQTTPCNHQTPESYARHRMSLEHARCCLTTHKTISIACATSQ